LNFLDRFSKNPQITNLKKICPVGAKLFYAVGQTDGQTDMTKLIVAFRNSANALKETGASEDALTAFLLTKCQREFSNEGCDEMSGESDQIRSQTGK
jgi:hypothetical protein